MNLAEIRKKAHQEKNAGARPSSSKASLAPATDYAEGSFDRSDAPVTAEEVLPEPVTVAKAEISASFETPDELPSIFDPVAVILAGRLRAGMAADVVDNQQEETTLENTGDFLKYLCFRVANEEYGVSLLEIREIIKPREITEVPGMPDFVEGVLSLRGIIIPVFNLQLRLGLAANEAPGRERIIVAKWQEGLFGLLVDEVYQVINLFVAATEEAPTVLEGIDREFVSGIGRHGQRMLILLNLEKIVDLSLC